MEESNTIPTTGGGSSQSMITHMSHPVNREYVNRKQAWNKSETFKIGHIVNISTYQSNFMYQGFIHLFKY